MPRKKEIKKDLSSKKYSELFVNILKHIEESKFRAFSEVNKSLLLGYWYIGKELNEHSVYGKSVVSRLSLDLKLKFPDVKGYSQRNLWNMKRFYETYQKLQTLSAESLFSLSWSNHVTILDMLRSSEEREFYLKLCIKERWSNRQLKRQISSALFERYVSVDNSKKVLDLIPEQTSKDLTLHFKDEYVLEFLDLEDEYSEKELENAILENLKKFFLEFGSSFTFMGSQYLIDIGGRSNWIDLLFFHRELKCLVAIDLKLGEFKASYVGQMQKYLAALDETVKLDDEHESIGLILCKSKNHEEVKFALAKTLSPVKVAIYKTKLPDKKLILNRLDQIFMGGNFSK